MKTRNIIWTISGILLMVVLVMATTTITDLKLTTVNATLTGTEFNFSTADASLKLYSQEHYNFGDGAGEIIELTGLTPEAKPYVGWKVYDPVSDSIKGVGWIGCHYNLTNGNTHQHCSFETLDNVTGDSTINTKLEFIYGGNLTQSDTNLEAVFSSLNRVRIGSGVDLHITDGDVLTGGNYDVFPSGQSVVGSRMSLTNGNLRMQGLGTSNFEFVDNVVISNNNFLRINANTSTVTCDSTTTGSIYFDNSTFQHFGCNATAWNALY